MEWSPCTIIISIVLTILLTLVLYLRRTRGYLETLGIPIVKPSFIFGSPPYWLHKNFDHLTALSLVKKYGKTFGYYDGTTPVIATIDPDLLTEIYIKKFDCFNETFDVQLIDRHKTIDLVGGQLWKELRKAITPTFTSGRLKEMMVPLKDTIPVFVDRMIEESKKSSTREVNLKPLLQEQALNMIGQCLYGININMDGQTKEERDLLDNARQTVQTYQCSTYYESFMKQMTLHFPFIQAWELFYDKGFDRLLENVKEMMNYREFHADIKRNDFLQKLIELRHLTKIDPPASLLLNENIVTCQACLMFLGGMEEVATTLVHLIYCLALNPGYQEELIQEVDAFLEENGGEMPFEALQELPYLDACIKEALRMYPPIHAHNRLCSKDCTINGIFFKKGTSIRIPIYAAHHMEEYFAEHGKYKPERFFKGNESSILDQTYRPFGGGHRICIGQRFGLIQTKMTAIQLFSKIKVVATTQTEKMAFKPGDYFLLYTDDLTVKFVDRQ